MDLGLRDSEAVKEKERLEGIRGSCLVAAASPYIPLARIESHNLM